jgi:hypothetical protein
MAHRFFAQIGYLSGTPFQEHFALVDQAADVCSSVPRCRGFTLSLAHMQDGHMHHVRFFDHVSIVLSADWLSYVKDPVNAHDYVYTPSYVADAELVDSVPMLHQQYTTLMDAHRFCDAEQACQGFVLRRHPSDDGSSASDGRRAWITFDGISQGATGNRARMLSVYDGVSVAYRKGHPLRTGASSSAPSERRTYSLQHGYLSDATGDVHDGAWRARHRGTLSEGEQYCSAHAWCVGFSTPRDTEYVEGDGSDGSVLWLSFWATGAQLVFSTEWVTYVQLGTSALGAYLLSPGFLDTEGAGMADSRGDRGGPAHSSAEEDDESLARRHGRPSVAQEEQPEPQPIPQPMLLATLFMSVDEGRAWCDRLTECIGFSINVAVPPSVLLRRADEANERAWLRFGRRRQVLYTPLHAGSGEMAGWVTFTKMSAFPIGEAANGRAPVPGTPLSWLLIPGFVAALDPSTSEPVQVPSSAADRRESPALLLRADPHAALDDVIDWCAASDACAGFTHAMPQGSVPVDRLAAACYCCEASVRTSRAQHSWVKWAPPRLPSQRLHEQREETGDEQEAGEDEDFDADSEEEEEDDDEEEEVLDMALENERTAAANKDEANEDEANDDEANEDESDRHRRAQMHEEEGEQRLGERGATTARDERRRSQRRRAEVARQDHFPAQLGYVAAGTAQLLRSGFTSFEQARRWCERRVRCHSIGCQAPRAGDAPAVVLFFSFYGKGGLLVHHPDWLLWRKTTVGDHAAMGNAASSRGKPTRIDDRSIVAAEDEKGELRSLKVEL